MTGNKAKAGMPRVQRLLGGFQQLIEALPFNSRHRGYRLDAFAAIENEHRVDQSSAVSRDSRIRRREKSSRRMRRMRVQGKLAW
jgi:hypothetical protein